MGPSFIMVGKASLTMGVDDVNFFEEGAWKVPKSAIYESMISCFHKSDKEQSHETYGPATYYHIIVDGKTLTNAAWTYKGPTAGVMRDYIVFRVSRIGDPGNPHYPWDEKPEGDGVSVVMDFFG